MIQFCTLLSTILQGVTYFSFLTFFYYLTLIRKKEPFILHLFYKFSEIGVVKRAILE